MGLSDEAQQEEEVESSEEACHQSGKLAVDPMGKWTFDFLK
jgi:hypothetical protein